MAKKYKSIQNYVDILGFIIFYQCNAIWINKLLFSCEIVSYSIKYVSKFNDENALKC